MSHQAPSEKDLVAALIVAAGTGSRVGAATPKQYLPLGGRPLLAHSLGAFLANGRIDKVLVVIAADHRALYDETTAGIAVPNDKLLSPETGGATRQASVRAGLERLSRLGDIGRVLIHDAARPFLPEGLVEDLLLALDDHDGALPGLAVVDSLRRREGNALGAEVERDQLMRAQTPQAFRFAEILDAHRRLADQTHTDDAALARAAGCDVVWVDGSHRLLKVTTEEDFARAEALLRPTRRESRTGFGFDVHRFGPGSFVWLCGIQVPHDAGLVGHSDADVGLHAITDALLGAMGEGDIGVHFPPSDARWKDAASDRFLAHAAALLRQKGGEISHIDVTLVCERPKVGPYRSAMVQRIAATLGIDGGRVSVKATTTEGLGFTGRKEGMAAQVVATVSLPREA